MMETSSGSYKVKVQLYPIIFHGTSTQEMQLLSSGCWGEITPMMQCYSSVDGIVVTFCHSIPHHNPSQLWTKTLVMVMKWNQNQSQMS